MAKITTSLDNNTLSVEILSSRIQSSNLDASDAWETVNRDLDMLSLVQAGTLIDIDPPDISNQQTSRSLPGMDSSSGYAIRSLEQSLLDLNTPFVSTLPNEHSQNIPCSIRLLLRNSKAYRFDSREAGKRPMTTEIMAGSLLKPTCELDNDNIISFLGDIGKNINDIFIARDCSLYDTYIVLSEKLTGELTRRQTELLFPIETRKRIELYNDTSRLNFVETVRTGSPVTFLDKDGCENDGRLVWKGLRDGHIWFRVQGETGGMSSGGDSNPVYVTAAQLFKSNESKGEHYYRKTGQSAPTIRQVPIKLVETGFETSAKSPQTAFSDDLRAWDGESFGNREYGERFEYHRKPIPPRSQSAHSGIASHSFSVSDPSRTAGMRVGDRVIWIKEGIPKKAVLKWIGQLKGHTSIYAGVEFDEQIGQGTGIYQQQELFKSPLGYAGFMLLSVLHRQQDIRRDDNHRLHDRVHLIEKRPEQASSGSLSDQAAPIPPPRRNREVISDQIVHPEIDHNVGGQRPEEFMIDGYGEGSCVDVWYGGHSRSGVVRWVGDALSIAGDRIEKSAIVELDSDLPYGWRPASGLATTDLDVSAMPFMENATLVPATALRRDSRFTRDTGPLPARPASAHSHIGLNVTRNDFGSVDSGVQITPCEPAKGHEELVGRMKGIQGNRNSCYLDATLYAMFVQSKAFDHLLDRPCQSTDIAEYEELKRILATEIVYPLRKFHYVRADHVMKLRELLAKALPEVSGLCGEEKDPEEILSHLFVKLFKAKPFLELIGKDRQIDKTYICPIVVGDFTGGVATTQHLLERSMREAHVSFAVPPNVLILQMPRYGQQKLFDRILPLESIEITPLVNGAPIPCYKCGQLAEAHCPECFLTKRVFLTEVSFCLNCFKDVHRSAGEDDHLARNYYPPVIPVKCPQSVRMSLCAVISIEMSHYVSFVRHHLTNKWLFFDSMADRQGLDDGFNVPEVKECEKMGNWLSLDGWNKLRASEDVLKQGGKGPENDPLVTRIMSDSYICFYTLNQSPNVSANLGEGILNLIKERF